MELIYTVGPLDDISHLPHQPGDHIEPPETVYDELRPAARKGRPYVALNMASTLDGRVTLTTLGPRQRIGSLVDRDIMRRLRARFDAVIRGAGTVRPEPYYPKVPADCADTRVRQGKSRHPLAVVVTNSCNLPYDRQFFQYDEAPAPTVVITTERAPEANIRAAREVATVRFAGTNAVDIGQALRLLHDEFRVTALLSEGGPRLNWDFIATGLLDELFWTIAPKVNGNENDIALVRGPGAVEPVPQLQLVSVYQHEGELYTRYAAASGREE